MGQQPLFDRLLNYYSDVAAKLRSESALAALLPNPTDLGSAREEAYASFLRRHCPVHSRVALGGFVFDDKGAESKQMDVMVTSESGLQFNLQDTTTNSKTIAYIESVLACFCLKSTLDGVQLNDSLHNLSSIPTARSPEGRVLPGVNIKTHEDSPYRVIFAPKGIEAKTLVEHLVSFYEVNPNIPITRRPNLIHVLGKYFIIRAVDLPDSPRYPRKAWVTLKAEPHPDALPLLLLLINIQQRAMAALYTIHDYQFLFSAILAKLDENPD